VAAFLRTEGGSILGRTGDHGRGVEHRVPEMTDDDGHAKEITVQTTKLELLERGDPSSSQGH